MSDLYADIIVDISHESLDRTFQYRIPPRFAEEVFPGVEVTIPFGTGNRVLSGYVISVSETPAIEPHRIKDITDVPKNRNSASATLIQLADYIRKTYGSTMINALKTVLPVKKKVAAKEIKTVVCDLTPEMLGDYLSQAVKKKQRAKERLLRELCITDAISYELVTGKLNVSSSTIQSLVKQGVIHIETRRNYRNPISFRRSEEIRPELSEEQAIIVNEIDQSLIEGKPYVSLIHGITGSGKTEVYLNLMERVIQRSGQAILLIPEIALTYQNVFRFYQRFGDKVSVIHSRLSDGEKYDQFERAKTGEISIMIGPRSALFTPFDHLEMIIIDEEHETSYKSETMPRFHAREVAIELARLKNAAVVLGSATPSLYSYNKAQMGEYKLYRMTRRLTGGSLPSVEIVDLRKELKEGNRSIFSRRLKELIKDRLEKGEQIMLFLNRRGLSASVSCRGCGEVIKCPHCDVSLSEHKGNRLLCHYCGYEMMKPSECPHCGGRALAGFRAGTEQIEEAVKKEFPISSVLRMDADTTKKKDDYEVILSRFSNREADILIGTQMIVKGHDFKGVTLVGILAADMSLSAPGYLSAEKTFQLLTQAAGRAGRGELPGEVVIQTYQPEHYAITLAAKQDYEAFFEEEMTYRDLCMYPPAAAFLEVSFSGSDWVRLSKLSGYMAAKIKEAFPELGFRQIGPTKALLSKKSDIYRQVIYYKHYEYDALVTIKDKIEELMEIQPLKDEAVMFDFNPMNFT